jgi:eukaryotic-like serine/threonine-protein kinase
MVDTCPTQEQLERMLVDSLAGAEAEAVERHVAGCDLCQRALEVLTAEDPTDALIAPGVRIPDSAEGDTVADRLRGTATPEMDPITQEGRPPPGLDATIAAKLASDPKVSPSSRWPAIPGYEIQEELGRGGMGVVYLARQVKAKRLVALKMILNTTLPCAEDRLRFEIEAAALAQLKHPNIVAVFEVGAFEDQPYFSLEYVNGGTLAQALASDERLLSARRAAAMVETLARAVHSAHQSGIIHRDLKPGNILLSRDRDVEPGATSDDPGWGTIKIADFGLAKHVGGDNGVTQTGQVLGTPSYMAPEQASSAGHVGTPADVFALGAILHELLVGRPPFKADTPWETMMQLVHQPVLPPSHWRKGVPGDLETICLRCLEKDPHRRYAGANALAEDLRRYLANEPIRARRVGELERVWKWARRRPAIAGLLALVLVSLVAGTVVSTLFGLAARKQTQAAKTSEGQAQASAQVARDARDRAEAAAIEASRQATRSTTRTALAAAQAGEIDRGLFGLLDALEAAPNMSPEDRAFRVALARNLAGWQAAQPVLRHIFEHVEKTRFVGPGGRVLALISGHWLRRVDLVTGQPIGASDGREFPGEILDVSPDGMAVLVTDVTPTDRPTRRFGLHDMNTGRLRAEYRVPADRAAWRIDRTQFGPGNRVIAFAHGRARGESVTSCWRVDRGEMFEPRTESSERVIDQDLRLFHGRNGRSILGLVPAERNASPRASDGLKFWDVDAGRPIDGFEPEPGSSGSDWVFDGKALVTLSPDAQRKGSRVHWWDPNTGHTLRPSWRPVRALVAPTLTADGRTLVVGCDDGLVRWYDLASGRECGIALEATVTEIGPQGAFVLGLDQGELRVWQAARPLRPVPKDDAGTLRLNYMSLDVRRDDGAVLVGQNDETGTMGRFLHHAVFSRGFGKERGAQIFDVASGRPLGSPLYPCDRQSVFSRDGRLVAASRTSVLKHDVMEATLIGVWETGSGRPVVPPTRISHYVHAMAFSPDARVLAVGVVPGLFLFDVSTGRATRFLAQRGPIGRIEFSPDGRLVAAGSRSGWGHLQQGVAIWDRSTARPVGPLWQCKQLPFFRFSPDALSLSVLDIADRRVVRLDAATGRPMAEPRSLDDGRSLGPATVQDAYGFGNSAAFDFRPDGAALAECRLSTVVRQWEMATGQPIGPPLRHDSPVIWIEYSPDGLTLACGCTDGMVQLWDAPSGQPVGPALPHDLPLLGLRFTRDGRTLIVVMTDGRPNSWPVPGPIATDEPKLIRSWLETTRGVRGREKGEFLDPMSRTDWVEGRGRFRAEWPSAPATPDARAMLARWHAARAAAAERGGDGNAAHRHLDDLASLGAEDWLLHARRARVFVAEGRFREADAEYAQAAGLASPEDLIAWYWRAAFDARNQDRNQAAVWYMDRVAAVRPDDPKVFVQRAEMNDRLGRPAYAEADRRRALALGPDVATICDLAEDWAILGDWSMASELFELAVEHSRAGGTDAPSDSDTVSHHALTCLHNGDQGGYHRLCERSVAIGRDRDIGDPAMAYSLAGACVLAPGALDEPGRAVQLAERSLASFAASKLRGEVLTTLGGALYRAGRSSDAIARLQEGIQLRGGQSGPQDWAFLAMAHQAQGDNSQARTWLSRFHTRETTQFWDKIEIDLLRGEAEAKVLYDPVFPADVFKGR